MTRMGSRVNEKGSMTERLDRIESILQVLAQETLANTRAVAGNAQATANNAQAIAELRFSIAELRGSIAELRDVSEQQNRAITYLMSKD